MMVLDFFNYILYNYRFLARSLNHVVTNFKQKKQRILKLHDRIKGGLFM